MINWLKSGLCKFGFMLGMLGAGTLNSGCEFLQPEGQIVQTYADGKISEQEEENIIDVMTAEHNVLIDDGMGHEIEITEPLGVVDFDSVQDIINDTDVFFNNEFEKRGFHRQGITKGLHIFMPEDQDELRTKYRMAYANLATADDFVHAFYSGANDTIYIPKGDIFTQFYHIMHHEIGHSMRNSDEELPSLANEIYSVLKLYALNKKIGSHVLPKVIGYFPRTKPDDWDEGYLVNYNIGAIGFLMQANKANGGLEEAVYNVMRAPEKILEKQARTEASKYHDMRDAYMGEMEKLLEQPGLRDSFDLLDDKEFSEIRDFLKAYNVLLPSIYDRLDMLEFMAEQGKTREELQEYDNPVLALKALQLGEDFLAKHDNPFFRARIINDLSMVYDFQKWDLGEIINESWQLEDVKTHYDLSQRIIDLNKDYPCTGDFMKCPSFVQEPGNEHVIAYLEALKFSYMLIDNGVFDTKHFLEMGEDFVRKFYADDNFEFMRNIRKNGRISPVGRLGPWINTMIGSLYVKEMFDSENWNDYRHNCKRAKDFYKFAMRGSCEVIEDAEDNERCKASIRNDFYTPAKSELENLESICPD